MSRYRIALTIEFEVGEQINHVLLGQDVSDAGEWHGRHIPHYEAFSLLLERILDYGLHAQGRSHLSTYCDLNTLQIAAAPMEACSNDSIVAEFMSGLVDD